MPLALVAAAVTAGATVYASSKASSAAKNATAAQTTANDQAIAEQQRQYDQTRADNAPWRDAGSQALAKLTAASNGDFSGFTASPDYKYRLQQDEQAVTGNRAARGLLNSGSLGAGLIKAAGNDSNMSYGDWWNRQAGLAGIGQSAVNSTNAAGQANANNKSGILQQNGQNLASSIATQGGIQSGLISSLGGTAAGLIKNYMAPASATSYGAPTAFGGSNFKPQYEV